MDTKRPARIERDVFGDASGGTHVLSTLLLMNDMNSIIVYGVWSKLMYIFPTQDFRTSSNPYQSIPIHRFDVLLFRASH